MIKQHAVFVGLVLVLLVATSASAQQILMDQGARVEGMWCFPSATDPKHWYYIPQTARLATDPSGAPVFSFVRYVINRPAAEGDSKGITSADGGGIVTLMATYDTPEELVRRAERALRRLVATRDQKDAEEVVLRGPVIFKSGRYVLVSSILRMKGGKEEKETQLLGMGNAPVFEGNEVAFSFDVTPEQSKLLLESFSMATPDISIVFDMTFTGLTDGYDATLTVDWSEVEKNQTIGGGVTVAKFISADIEKGFQELHKSQAIKLVTRGAHPNMEALLDKVHTKLLDVMFKKVEPEKQPQKQGDQGLGMLAGLLGAVSGGQYTGAAADYAQGAGTGALSRNTSSFVGVSFQYEKKELKKSGTTVFHMNNQVPIDRNVTMVANIGDLYTRYKDDGNRFRTVNLSDPAYQQREVHVGIDGAILPEFDKYVNSVTVTLRKTHQNGAQTLREVVLDRNTFNKESRDFRMVYGWNGDDDRAKWLEYEYRTRWSFKGGGLHETDWTKTDINMIDLYAPYRRNTVQLVGDSEALAAQGVRAIAVHVEYDFFDGRRSQDLALPTSEPIDGKEIEITLPLDVYAYDYSVTWLRKGAPPAEAKGTDDTGVIFVDEIPAAESASATGIRPMRHARSWQAVGIGIAWLAAGGGCVSPTVTLATDKPIEIKIDLQHEVRVHVDREVSEMIDAEGERVGTRDGTPDDEELARAAKARGALGEQANGYLGLRSPAPEPADRALAERLNARRREQYLALARENGVPLAQVEKTAGAGRLEAAASGEWVRTPDGHWIEKTESTVVVVQDQSGA